MSVKLDDFFRRTIIQKISLIDSIGYIKYIIKKANLMQVIIAPSVVNAKIASAVDRERYL